MTTDAVLATLAELGARHCPLEAREVDGVPVVRCLGCGHAEEVGR